VSPTTRSEVAAGVRASWTVGLGLLPLGLAFGLLVSQSGFAWWWTPVFSFVIYAGSMEFLAISLVTGGVAPLSAAVTGFLVNFRHIFYGLSYPVSAVRSPVAKAYGVYALTDETYAILSSHRGATWTQPKVMAVQAFCQASWVLPGIVGALVGAALPMDVEGLDFALTALFVVLAIEAMSARRDVLLPVVAVVTGVVGLLISRDQMLLIGLTLYFAFLVGRFLWDRRKDAGCGAASPGSSFPGSASADGDPEKGDAS
jgi:4-azaleucine resistance transporter AzlC